MLCRFRGSIGGVFFLLLLFHLCLFCKGGLLRGGQLLLLLLLLLRLYWCWLGLFFSLNFAPFVTIIFVPFLFWVYAVLRFSLLRGRHHFIIVLLKEVERVLVVRDI